MVAQAIADYSKQAATIFRKETDLPQDIAEDVTREALEAMGMPSIPIRLYGKVDFKKAIYVFLPDVQPVALMVDAKAEKPEGAGTATIQMSQTSMQVIMMRSNERVNESGKLDMIIKNNTHNLYVVTIIAKYVYKETRRSHLLERIILACIPNGKLQKKYNPSEIDTIWRAGRNAPTLGEDFRVRVSFNELQRKASWRVKKIDCLPKTKQPHGSRA